MLAVAVALPPGYRNSVASCCASVALPPLPKASNLPAGLEPAGHLPRAGLQPSAVGVSHHAAQPQDLVRLGDGRLAHLLQYVGYIRGAGVEEGIQRLDGPGRGALRRRRRHDTTAIASLACTRSVSPTDGRDERDADFLLGAPTGIDYGQPVIEQSDDGDLDSGCLSR